MGFGLLFIGYIFFLYVLPVGTQFLSVASAILLLALYKLSRYHAGFRRAAYLSALLLFLGLPSLLSTLLGISFPSELYTAFAAAAWAILVVFHLLTFGAIAELAKRTKLFRLEVAATQNRLFSAVFCVLLLLNELLTLPLLSRLPETDANRILIYILIGKAVLGLIIVGLNLVMLYSAYMRFCQPGQEQRGVFEYEQLFTSKDKDKPSGRGNDK